MRQPLFKADYLSVLGYALGNSIGAYIAIEYGLISWQRDVVLLIFCFGVGLTFDRFIAKFEQRKGAITWKHVLASYLIFFILQLIAVNYFRYDMTNDFLENLTWFFGFGFLAFFATKLWLYYKVFKTKKKYKDGSQGYDKFSNHIEYNPGANYKLNEEITGEYDKNLAVVCANGIFVGRKHSGVVAYKGIPFAKPPVGNLRWRKPEEPESSSKVFEAHHFSAVLPQPHSFASELGYHPQSENCLTLNIWRGEKAKTKLPVVVYFHGGDYSFGGSANPLYDGENFIKKNSDLIYVSFNYRFGIFGIMDFSRVPGGEDYADAKNLIFYDQIAALEWVQKNIAAFGGDPDNVTIMGDTAGGTCALLLPLIEKTKGLFKRIIAISAYPTLYTDAKLAQALTEKIQEYFQLRNMEDFQCLTEQQLVEMESKFYGYLNCPIFDNTFIPEDIYAAYAQGRADGIEFILGSNADEFNTYVAYSGKEQAHRLLKSIIDFILQRIHSEDLTLYQQFMDEANNDYKQFINYISAHTPLLMIAKNLALRGNSVRYFHWFMGSPIKEFGAFSAIETPYILENKDKAEKFTVVGEGFTGELLQKMLVQFIKGQDPSLQGGMVQHNEAVPWPAFQKGHTPILDFKNGAALDKGDIIKKSDLIEQLLINNQYFQKENYLFIHEEFNKMFRVKAD